MTQLVDKEVKYIAHMFGKVYVFSKLPHLQFLKLDRKNSIVHIAKVKVNEFEHTGRNPK